MIAAIALVVVLALWSFFSAGPVATGVTTNAAGIATLGKKPSRTGKHSDLPEGFVAEDPELGEAQGVHTVELFRNGGNMALGRVNVTQDNFKSLGVVYNNRGQQVRSFAAARMESALWRGPETPGTHFMWPGVSVGHRVTVPGLKSLHDKPIELETLSTGNDGEPRVFYVHNFLASEEAEDLIEWSTNPKNPYGMAPSTAGTEKAWNQGGRVSKSTSRTSMNAFDITTQNSVNIKERAMHLLRLPKYEEPMLDGIQILRYTPGQAYIVHGDYFETYQSQDHNWDPTKGGSNRFATVFLYLNDVEIGGGGQTVFGKVPASQTKQLFNSTRDRMMEYQSQYPTDEEIKEMVKAGEIPEGSWEVPLLNQCYKESFSIPPRKGDAILFYSQTPTGHLDVFSQHGACPVVKGIKWAANIWVWNACRWSMCGEGNAMKPATQLPAVMTARNTPLPTGLIRKE